MSEFNFRLSRRVGIENVKMHVDIEENSTTLTSISSFCDRLQVQLSSVAAKLQADS